MTFIIVLWKENLSKKSRCLSKTHAEGVVESMGSFVEMHADKRRGTMDISDIGKESMIHWNGPPLARADSLGEAAINRYFGGGRFSSN